MYPVATISYRVRIRDLFKKPILILAEGLTSFIILSATPPAQIVRKEVTSSQISWFGWKDSTSIKDKSVFFWIMETPIFPWISHKLGESFEKKKIFSLNSLLLKGIHMKHICEMTLILQYEFEKEYQSALWIKKSLDPRPRFYQREKRVPQVERFLFY